MKPTTLIIDAQSESPITLQATPGNELHVGNVNGRILQVLLSRNNDEYAKPYYSYNNLSNTKEIEILFRDWEGRIGYLELPEWLRQKISELMTQIKINPDLYNTDCLGLVKFIYGEKDIGKGGLPKCALDVIQPSDVQPGDIAYLQQKINDSYKNEYHHAAIYLGASLYLSKLGPDGGIISFNTDEQLGELYSPDKVSFLRKSLR